MKALFCILSVTCLSSSLAFACLPPPTNYFSVGGMRSILENQEVIKLMGEEVIQSIEMTSQDHYEVRSSKCSLPVEVKVEQINENGPCPGPYSFTSIPGELVCQ